MSSKTLIKTCTTTDGKTTLTIFKVYDWRFIRFTVELKTNGKLIGKAIVDNYEQALLKWYNLLDDGIRFNNYQFEVKK
jgi:hypothetical protein